MSCSSGVRLKDTKKTGKEMYLISYMAENFFFTCFSHNQDMLVCPVISYKVCSVLRHKLTLSLAISTSKYLGSALYKERASDGFMQYQQEKET